MRPAGGVVKEAEAARAAAPFFQEPPRLTNTFVADAALAETLERWPAATQPPAVGAICPAPGAAVGATSGCAAV